MVIASLYMRSIILTALSNSVTATTGSITENFIKHKKMFNYNSSYVELENADMEILDTVSFEDFLDEICLKFLEGDELPSEDIIKYYYMIQYKLNHVEKMLEV